MATTIYIFIYVCVSRSLQQFEEYAFLLLLKNVVSLNDGVVGGVDKDSSMLVKATTDPPDSAVEPGVG